MIQNIFGTFDPALALQFTVQTLLALLLGGLVGFDRERRNMPAGVRTFMLVSVGSCIFTILSYYSFPGSDPARVAAQIVTGIGFLGAGVMIQRKGTVYGLTSAAGVWTAAATGMAVGTGNYFLAGLSAVTIYIVLAILRRWFKVDAVRSTRHTLNTALRQVRDSIDEMARLVEHAIQAAVQAVIEDDHVLAQQIIENDEQINDMRYQIEEECLDILRTHHPHKIQLRAVLAAAHISTNLERIGDYGKEIARNRLQIGHNSLPASPNEIQSMANQVCDLLRQALTAFNDDDVAAAKQIGVQASVIDRQYETIVESITDHVNGKKTKHFERGVRLLNIAYHLKRAGERVTNIAERIIFVRTGALRELERED